ncbi:MAG: universal stress protein [Bacteroidota bacterium]
MKKLLVPTDFSPQANYALRSAYQLALKNQASIHLVHVLDFPLVDEEAPVSPIEIVPGEFLQKAEEETKEQLKNIAESKELEDVEVTYEVRVGNPYQSIVRALVAQKVDMVVMGSKGISGTQEMLIGSNAERMVRFSPSPVLIIKEKADLSDIKHIVYATALKEKEKPVITTLAKLQEMFDAQLHIVRVNTVSNFRDDSSVRKQLKSLAETCYLKNYTLNTFSDIREEEGIIHFADEVGADLIALATNARRGLMHLLGGSIAEDVANHAKYPVWTMSLPKVFS